MLAAIAVIVIAALQFSAVAAHPSRNLVLGLSAAAVIFVIASNVFSILERRRQQRGRQTRDKALADIAGALATLTKSPPEKATEIKSSLRERVAQGGRDLLIFLREKPPVPDQPPMRARPTGGKESWEEKWKHFRK